jgi:hypothetical protein
VNSSTTLSDVTDVAAVDAIMVKQPATNHNIVIPLLYCMLYDTNMEYG